MAIADTTWYCNSVGYAAVTARPQNTAVAAGVIRKQFTAPAVGSERCFVSIVAGTTANTTDATWATTRGAKTTDGTVTWQECTGTSAMNGDLTNTPNWTQQKAAISPTLGNIIKRNNGASYQICSTAGGMGTSEPAFSDTAGVTTADSTTTWTSLGPVGNFSGGGAPHARLTNAIVSAWVGAVGTTVFVGDNHAESQSTTMTVTVPTSGAALNRVLCHNHSGSYPPAASDLATGATVTTTAASANIGIAGNGSTYFYGLTFQAGSGVSTGTANITLGATNSGLVYDNCSFQTLDTATGSQIFLGSSGAFTSVVLNNCSFKFGNVGHNIQIGGIGHYVWQNTASPLAAGSSVPTNLFNWNQATSGCKLTVEAVDLSTISGILVNYSNPLIGDFVFKDCKLHASVSPSVGVTRPNNTTQLVRSDSGATAYKSARYANEGTETTETAITRHGGAQDPSGQAQSRKIVTTANPTWPQPYKAEPYAIWNPTTGANVVVTVCGVTNAVTMPVIDELWMDVEYLGSSSSPLGSFASTNKASVLATAAALTADTSDWDDNVTARANSTAYAVGDVRKTASNPGRIFFCTQAGTSDSSEPSGTTNTWNPNDRAGSTPPVLSNGNLTATFGSNNCGVRAKAPKPAKFYFEVTNSGGMVNGPMGVTTAAGSLTTLNLNGVASAIFHNATGAIWVNNSTSQITPLGASVGGDVICVAVDMVNQRIWIRRNGGNWNSDAAANPATNVGGFDISALGTVPLYPVVMFGGSSAGTAVANFGATTFAQTMPSGFSAAGITDYANAADGETVQDATAAFRAAYRFKLEATLSSPQPGLAGYLEARARAARASTTYYLDPRPVLS
jgi:hypothetical protein